MDSNQAIPTLLAGRDRRRLESQFPGLHVLHAETLSLFAYPLSGGFRPVVPGAAGAGRDRCCASSPASSARLGRYAGFRLLLVLERR